MTEFQENLNSSRALLESLTQKIANVDADLQETEVNCSSHQHHVTPKLVQNMKRCGTIAKELQHIINYFEASFHKQQGKILQLNQENDKLILQEAGNQEKINLLLSMNMTKNDLVTLKNTVTKSQYVPQEQKYKKDNSCSSITGMDLKEMFGSTPDGTKEVRMHAQALLAELTEQKKFYLEQLQVLCNEREITVKQKLEERKILKIQVSKLSKKLKETQEKLNKVSAEFSKLKQKQSAENSFWLAEKDNIQSSLEHCKEMLQKICSLLSSYSTSPNSHNKQDLALMNTLNMRLQQAENLLVSYQQQIQVLEQTVTQYQEIVNKKRSRSKAEMLNGKLAHLKKKYRALYERRRLEMEGFQNDITMLRKRLDDVKTLLHKYISLNLQNQSSNTRRKPKVMYQAYLSEQEIKTLKSEVWTTEKLVKSGTNNVTSCGGFKHRGKY